MSDSREAWQPSQKTINKYRELGYSQDEAYEMALEEEFDELDEYLEDNSLDYDPDED